MSDDASSKAVPRAVFGALDASGFPFQTAIAEIVRRATGWELVEIEYPWQDASGNDEFLDLVATGGTLVLAIECKKTGKEILTFLQPVGMSGSSSSDRVRCLVAAQIQDSTPRVEINCAEISIQPPSPESQFCVVGTSDSGKNQRMLERDARLVVRGAEAVAHEYREAFLPSTPGSADRVFLPVLVTNAPLFVARYRASAISLESGQFGGSPPRVDSVPWVRFRKAFTSSGGRDLGDRTVLVVNANHLNEFLELLEIPSLQRGDPRPVYLPRRLAR